MRLIPFLLILALGACGEPIRDDHFANDTKPERQDPALTTSAAPVRVGELGPNFNACSAVGTTRHVAVSDTLAVQAAPFSTAARTGSLSAGARFFVCSRSLDQKWLGVVHEEGGGIASGCGVAAPVASRRDYQGPCRSGWVSSALVKMIAGNDQPGLPPQASPPRPGSGLTSSIPEAASRPER